MSEIELIVVGIEGIKQVGHGGRRWIVQPCSPYKTPLVIPSKTKDSTA